ncbi:hypothetical protein M0R45_036201 [Rubus argutus]|uniref:Uncharacterized protein n=1 Tax=Rubus argutus TaxID=59490 RepID=A0AAW1VY59_RUBAR
MGLIAAMGFAIRSTAGSGLPVWRSAEERRRRCLVRPWAMAERGREFGELGFEGLGFVDEGWSSVKRSANAAMEINDWVKHSPLSLVKILKHDGLPTRPRKAGFI